MIYTLQLIEFNTNAWIPFVMWTSIKLIRKIVHLEWRYMRFILVNPIDCRPSPCRMFLGLPCYSSCDWVVCVNVDRKFVYISIVDSFVCYLCFEVRAPFQDHLFLSFLLRCHISMSFFERVSTYASICISSYFLLWISTGLGEQILPRNNCFYFISEAADESRFRFLFVSRTREAMCGGWGIAEPHLAVIVFFLILHCLISEFSKKVAQFVC